MLTQTMTCVLHEGERIIAFADLLASYCSLRLVICYFAEYNEMLQCEAEMLQASLSNIHSL